MELHEKVKVRASKPQFLSKNSSFIYLFEDLKDLARVNVWVENSSGETLYSTSKKSINDYKNIKFEKKQHYLINKNFKHRLVRMSITDVRFYNNEKGKVYVVIDEISRFDLLHPVFKAFAFGLALIGFVIALMVLPVSRIITKPLKKLTRSANKIADGDLQVRPAIKNKDEIGELGYAFNTMVDKIETMISDVRELTAHISHELRSPLARMRINLELIHDKLTGDEKLNTTFSKIEKEIESMDLLIGKILTLSKIEMSVQKSINEINLSTVINSIIEKAEGLLSHKNIKCTFEPQENCVISGHEDDIIMAYSNLIENAIKYSKIDSTIHITIKKIKNKFIVSIANESLKEIEQINKFKKAFYRENNDVDGFGLGLTIAERIFLQHNSELSLEVQGNTFIAKIIIDI